MAVRGLQRMAWRGLLRRKGRTALTVLTVTIGVANVFGVFVINSSIDRGIESRTRFFAGGADATARTGPGSPAGFTRQQIERLRGLDGVDDASAVTPVWDSDSPPGREGEDYYVSSIDSVGREVVLADRLIRGRLFEPGRPEVVLSRTFSRAFGLEIGDEWRTDLRRFLEEVRASRFSSVSQTLEPGAPTLVRLEVTGILEDPPGSGNDPRFGSFMSLEYAWSVLSGDFAYEVRFFLEDGVDPAAWVVEHETGFQESVFESSAITPELRRFVSTMQGMLAGTSALALFIGAFLIYVTFSIAVVERTRLYGSLHAIGARGGQVAGAVFIEALTIGVVSSALGVVLGFVLSRGLTRLVQPVIPIFVESTTVTPGALAAALAVGLGATAVGAAVPALRAARTSPVEAMRDVSAATQRPSRSWAAGVLLLGGGLTFAVVGNLGRDLAISGLATLLVLLGAVLMTPLALALTAGAVRWVVRRIGGRLGDVAVMHVQRERSRSAYTMALLMVVLAAMLTLGTANSSLQNILEEWMDRRFGGDLLIYGPDMTEALRRELVDVPGVAASTSFDFGSRIGIGSPSTSQNLILIDPASFFDVAGFPWVDGSDDVARAALEKGLNVLLPSRLAKTLDVERGDQVELASGPEEKTFDVAGIYATFGEGPQIGVVASLEEPFFQAGEDRAVVFLDYTREASHERVLSQVEKILAPPQGAGSRFELQPEGFGRAIGGFFVITGAEAKEEARVGLNSFFRLFLAVILIAAIVGVLGMTNTLAATVLQRVREIGILQAVGSTPREVRRMVLVESAVLTFVAFILSIALGALLAWMFVKGASADIGFDIELAFPWKLVPILGLVASVIALLAAAVPARRASRLTPVEALRYE